MDRFRLELFFVALFLMLFIFNIKVQFKVCLARLHLPKTVFLKNCVLLTKKKYIYTVESRLSELIGTTQSSDKRNFG